MKYKINLNGKAYEVEVEHGSARVLGTAETAAAPPAPVPASAGAVGTETGEQLCAPMPGAILEVKVSAGESVAKGQVLFILEAMKMENEVVAPRAAKVTKIAASKGDTVNAGDPLAWLV